MFLTNSDIYIALEKSYSCIDNEIGQYFIKIENTILDFINKGNNIYGFQKDDIVKKVFYNNDFKEFLLELICQISDQLNSNCFEVSNKNFDVDLESISQFNINSTLCSQYRLSYHLAKSIEKNIDETISSYLFSGISNKVTDIFLDNLSPADAILSFTNLSSHSFNKRHRVDMERRIKGILLNFKVRLKNNLKSQVYNHLQYIQKNNIRTA